MITLRTAWATFIFALGLIVVFALAGCTTAKPPIWLLYADGKQAWGRMQVQFEVLCDPITPQNSRICAEAAQQNNALVMLDPTVRTELSKERPDWAVIMQWVQIAVGIASKFVPMAVGPMPPRQMAPPSSSTPHSSLDVPVLDPWTVLPIAFVLSDH